MIYNTERNIIEGIDGEVDGLGYIISQDTIMVSYNGELFATFNNNDSILYLGMKPNYYVYASAVFDKCKSYIQNSEFVANYQGMLIQYNGSESNVVIPEQFTSISASAFYKAKDFIRSIETPKTLTETSMFALADCHSLERVVFKEGMKKIENNTFAFCDNLKDVFIPNSVAWIGDDAFRGCDKDKLTIHCEQYSFAHHYAAEKGIKFDFDDSDPSAAAARTPYNDDNEPLMFGPDGERGR